MSKYSPLELIKREAKRLSKAQGTQLSSAQQQIALQYKFASFHELTKVACQKAITDQRVLLAAFSVLDLKETIWEDGIPQDLEDLLDEQMNGAISETNATEFSAEDIEIESASYDEQNGKLTLQGSLTYSGYQDQDRPFSGSAFYLDVELELLRRDGKWVFDEESGLIITGSETDSDRDRQLELDDLYDEYLAEKAKNSDTKP